MTSYKPTEADYRYILENDPSKFADPVLAVRELDKIVGDLGNAQYRLDAVSRNYEQGGNPPLTAPAPTLLPDADGDGTLDPEFAGVCTDCAPGQPCCMTEGYVADGDDLSRMILWPAKEGQPQTLLMVAKEREGTRLVANVYAVWQGQKCRTGRPNSPRLEATRLVDHDYMLTEQSEDVKVGIAQMPSISLALRNYIPENVLYILYAFDAVMAWRRTIADGEKSVFSPVQCLSDGTMGTALNVVPLRYAKMDGTVSLATNLVFSTGGVGGSATASGELTGQYGHYTLQASGSAIASESTGSARTRHRNVPGLIGTMASVIAALDKYVAAGNTKSRFKVDRSAFGSNITLNKTLTFNPKAIELRAKPGSPDLLLDVGGMDSSLTISAVGRLDFIDALAMAFSGPGYRVIQDARARMAAGEYVSATLDAYLELSTSGLLTHKIDKPASITIPASGEFDASMNALSQSFGGELKISGTARLAISVKAEIWIFKASAGMSGSIHTAWTWKMRMQGGQRQKCYVFDGVIVTYIMHAGVSVSSKDGGVGEDIVNLEAGDKNGDQIMVFAGEETAWEEY